MREKARVRTFVMIFIRVMLILAFIGAYQNQRWLVLFISGLAFFATLLPRILESGWGIKIPADFEIMVILFIYGTLFFGEVRGFYAKFWWWDIILNLGTAIALGFVGLTIMYVLYKDERLDASPLIIAVFAFTFSVAAGTLWEFFEYSVDTFFSFQMQQASLADTMTDLIVNAVGALIVSTAGYIYLKQGKRNLISRAITNFVEKNPLLFRAKKPDTPEQKILKIIKQGESEKIEFKSALRNNIHTNLPDRRIELANLKTINAFLNSNGGTLLVGVADDGTIIGTKQDNFPSKDKLNLHLANLIKQHIGKEFFRFIKFETVDVKGKEVLQINVEPSDKEAFLNADKTEEFYIRSGPSTVKLIGRELVDYISRKFRKE